MHLLKHKLTEMNTEQIISILAAGLASSDILASKMTKKQLTTILTKMLPSTTTKKSPLRLFMEEYEANKESLVDNTYFNILTKKCNQKSSKVTINEKYRLCVKKGSEDELKRYVGHMNTEMGIAKVDEKKPSIPTSWTDTDWTDFVDAWAPAKEEGLLDDLDDHYFDLDTFKIAEKKKKFSNEEFRICSRTKKLVDQVVAVLQFDEDKEVDEAIDKEEQDDDKEEQDDKDEEQDEQDDDIANNVVCFSGKMTMVRKDLEAMVVAKGASVKKSVTKDTTLLVTDDADSTSKKIQDAKKKGVKVISEQEFMKMYE